MQTCYYCGNVILGRKIMGLVGGTMRTFCSDRCRSASWIKAENKSPSNEASGLKTEKYISSKNEQKSVSSLAISGAEYEYSAKTDGITIRIKKLENKSEWATGKLRLELFASKSGEYRKGSSVSGTTIAVSSSYDSLRKNYSYTNMSAVSHIREKPKLGTYTPILFVRELGTDGEWHIAGFVNFPAKLKWS